MTDKKELKAIEVLSYGAQVTVRVSSIESAKLYQGRHTEIEITTNSGSIIRTTTNGLLESKGYTALDISRGDRGESTNPDTYKDDVKEAEHELVNLYHDLQEALGFTE